MRPETYLKKVHKLIPQIVALTREENLWVLWDKVPSILTDPDDHYEYFNRSGTDPIEIVNDSVQIESTKEGDYELHIIEDKTLQ